MLQERILLRLPADHEGTDPAFAQLFMEAVRVGVEIYPLVLSCDGTNIRFLRAIPYP